MRVETRVEVDFIVPEQTLQRHTMWNAGMNLLKSSMQEVRNTGFDMCTAVLDFDKENGKATLGKRIDIREFQDFGNPK